MSRFSCLFRRALVLALLTVGVSGCVSGPKSTAPVHVLATAKGVVCFQKQQFDPDQLARHLGKAGVDEEQEIRVHLEDPRNTRLQKQLSSNLLSRGYKRVLFLAQPRATSEVVGEPDTRTEVPVQHDAPP